MKVVHRDELKRRLDQDDGPLVVEVLSPQEYGEGHLPGAINVPLDNFEHGIQKAVPDKSEEVVVYCGSTQCDASEKAAQKMEGLGYEHVLDYEAGKADWKEGGLPLETSLIGWRPRRPGTGRREAVRHGRHLLRFDLAIVGSNSLPQGFPGIEAEYGGAAARPSRVIAGGGGFAFTLRRDPDLTRIDAPDNPATA
jgi:rhodanese-related sulfurtransferase